MLYAIPAEAYSYQVSAEDPNNDTLLFELVSSPGDMLIDETSGLITWSTSLTLTSEHIEVKVSDPSGLEAIQKFIHSESDYKGQAAQPVPA